MPLGWYSSNLDLPQPRLKVAFASFLHTEAGNPPRLSKLDWAGHYQVLP
jgi:hypothetical protein